MVLRLPTEALLALGILTLILIVIVLPLKTIRLIGFQGGGRKADWLIRTEPLIYAGHVALSYDGGYRFYGFTPHAPGWDMQELLITLKAGTTFPGVVQDDTDRFVRALERYQQGYTRTSLYEWRQRCTFWRWWWIRWRVRRAVRRSPLRIRYKFPNHAPACYNCATWPAQIGVRIPEPTGRLRVYIAALRRNGKERIWRPQQ